MDWLHGIAPLASSSDWLSFDRVRAQGDRGLGGLSQSSPKMSPATDRNTVFLGHDLPLDRVNEEQHSAKRKPSVQVPRRSVPLEFKETV